MSFSHDQLCFYPVIYCRVFLFYSESVLIFYYLIILQYLINKNRRKLFPGDFYFSVCLESVSLFSLPARW